MASLHLRLRDATRSVHASVERALPLARHELTREAYRRILSAFLGFYVPTEAELLRMARQSGEVDLLVREKAPRLRQDLRALGTSESELAEIPTCPEVPSVEGFDRFLGCLYVLEGATLGGQIIARHLHKHLAIDASSGGSFFHAHGAETGAVWRAFVARLEREEPPFDGAVAAAVETFECLERWLAARGAPTWQT